MGDSTVLPFIVFVIYLRNTKLMLKSGFPLMDRGDVTISGIISGLVQMFSYNVVYHVHTESLKRKLGVSKWYRWYGLGMNHWHSKCRPIYPQCWQQEHAHWPVWHLCRWEKFNCNYISHFRTAYMYAFLNYNCDKVNIQRLHYVNMFIIHLFILNLFV